MSIRNDSDRPDSRPNIVVILVDDMGFSDIGCYGSEIQTPNIDRMAATGVKFSQMYNCARCCPTRASLLTGLYPHRAGVGHMVNDRGVGTAYQGYLSDNCVTIAEVLREEGYRTFLAGKWHVGGYYQPNDPRSWYPGGIGHPTPLQRGFDEFYGMLGGAGSYFNPPFMMRDNRILKSYELCGPREQYYFTDAITDEAVRMIRSSKNGDDPFFLYLAYTAPHWPLHALPEDISRYRGLYRKGGWDQVRMDRHEKLKALDILDPAWDISPRDENAPAWSDVKEKDWEDLRMAVYAAQVDRMDQGVGKILDTLRDLGMTDNTLILFLSDNGGCAEFLAEDTNTPEPFRYDIPARDGRPMRIGNTPAINPGPDDTFASYDLPWANASNTPFRLYKSWVHEGGISTPMVVQWPEKISDIRVVHEPTHVVDIMATCLEAAGASYPSEYGKRAITPLEGESFLPLLLGRDRRRQRPIFFEHQGNRAIRMGRWKMVSRHAHPWELYNLEDDRTELYNLAERECDRVKSMAKPLEEWASRCGVLPWPLQVRL